MESVITALVLAISIPLSVFLLIQGWKILRMSPEEYENRRLESKSEMKAELRNIEMLQEMGWVDPNWLGRKYITFLKFLSKDKK